MDKRVWLGVADSLPTPLEESSIKLQVPAVQMYILDTDDLVSEKLKIRLLRDRQRINNGEQLQTADFLSPLGIGDASYVCMGVWHHQEGLCFSGWYQQEFTFKVETHIPGKCFPAVEARLLAACRLGHSPHCFIVAENDNHWLVLPIDGMGVSHRDPIELDEYLSAARRAMAGN